HSILPCAPAPHAPGTVPAPRSRGRHTRRMHEDPAPRVRPRRAACLCTPSATGMAAVVRQVLHAISRRVQTQPGQQAPCPALATLVRPEPPRRGFCGDVRRLAAPPVRLASPICRLAGAPKAAVRGPPDEGNRRTAPADPVTAPCGSAPDALPHAVRALHVPTCPLFDRVSQDVGY